MKHVCPMCKIEKEWSLINFHRNASRKNKLETYCKKCVSERYKKRIEKRKNEVKIKRTEKKCSKCGEIKKIPEFYHSIRSLDGYDTQCKECNIKRNQIILNTLNGTTNNCIMSAKRRAKKKKVENNLTHEFIRELYKQQNGLCVLSKIKMEYESGHEKYHMNPYRISIDRIDSTQGYTQDNVQLVCAKVNTMKNEMEQNEFIELCGQIYKGSNSVGRVLR